MNSKSDAGMYGLDLSLPFTRAMAHDAGVTDKMLRSRRFVKMRPSVFVDAYVAKTSVLRAQVALVGMSDSARVSHTTAARLFGIPVPIDPDDHVSVSRPELRSRRAGVRAHVSKCARQCRRYSVLTSSPRQIFVELAAMLPLVDVVVAGDAMIASGLSTIEALREWAEVWHGRGAKRAREALRFVREGVESPMESRLRMLVVLAGLPEPTVNATVETKRGRRRLDLSWRDGHVALEYDGRYHIEREVQWERDTKRREDLEALGWRFITATAKDVYTSPDEFLGRLHSAMLQCRVPGTPSTLTQMWSRHFRTQ